MIAGLPKILLLASLGVQAALSIIAIALHTQRQQFITKYEGISISLGADSRAGSLEKGALPEGLNNNGSRLNLANAILVLVTSAALIIMVMIANGQRKRVSNVLQKFCLVFGDCKRG